MNREEVKAFLERIDYRRAVRQDEETLGALVRAHLEHVPFENLDIYDFGKLPELDEKALFDKVVTRRRGGYCFELNMLFGALLEALGFNAYPVMARVLWNRDGIPPASHMGIVVILGEKKYFCDVGYGGPGPKGLTEMESGEYVIDGTAFRVSREEDQDLMIERLHHGEWKRILRFSDIPVRKVDFQTLNFYCARNEKIMFRQKRLLNLCTPNGSKALKDMELTVRDGQKVSAMVYRNREELERGLRDEFGICVSLVQQI